MQKITTILWDIDDTLLDFQEAEKNAIISCFNKYNLGNVTEEMLQLYSQINKKYWQKLELGQLTKSQVLLERFEEFFLLENIPTHIASDFNDDYQIALGQNPVFKDNSYKLVMDLKRKGYKQYVITNGTKVAQYNKLKNSKLIDVMDGIFISDEIGFQKPNPKFFEHIFKILDSLKKDECIVVGDSLTSDIKGANNFDIKSCWYNPNHKPNDTDARFDYEIDNLNKLLDILNS